MHQMQDKISAVKKICRFLIHITKSQLFRDYTIVYKEHLLASKVI